MLAAARDEAAAKVLDGDPGRGVSDGSNLKIMEKSIKILRLILKAKKIPVWGYIVLIVSNGEEHKKTAVRRDLMGNNFFMLFLCRA